MWIVVGLGNPGRQYVASRHNVGFTLVKKLADKQNVKFKTRKYLAKAAQIVLNNKPILLVKPWTYMNRSGLAVKNLIEGTGVKLNRLLVVYDDLDIPLGEIRVRKWGGPGSHNGMASISQEVASTKFPRIRIGIGPLPPDIDATNFVLADFQNKEKPVLAECLAMAEEAVVMIIEKGIETAMNRFNRRLDIGGE